MYSTFSPNSSALSEGWVLGDEGCVAGTSASDRPANIKMVRENPASQPIGRMNCDMERPFQLATHEVLMTRLI
jgi:hypothetical protein